MDFRRKRKQPSPFFSFADTKRKRSDPPVTCGASPLYEKGPLNLVYLCKFKRYFPICRGELCSPVFLCRDRRPRLSE